MNRENDNEESAPVNKAAVSGPAGNTPTPSAAAADKPAIAEGSSTTSDSHKSRDGTEKQKEISKFAGKTADTKLWKIISDCTCGVEAEDDDDFRWPEPREHTEGIIQMLIKSRVLILKSCNDDWFYKSAQRLASVLYASMQFEGLRVRMIRSGKKFDFDEWVKVPPSLSPVVIIVPADRSDSYQSFFNSTRKTIFSEIIPKLKKANLYVVFNADETIINQKVLNKQKDQTKNLYPVWEVPAVKLWLIEKYPQEGRAVYEELFEKKLSGTYSQQQILQELISHPKYTLDDIIQNVSADLENTMSGTEAKVDALKQLLRGDDLIRKVIISVGAFFKDLYYADFFFVVEALLGDEKEDLPHTNTTAPPSAPARPPALLKDSWRKRTNAYLEECFLKTTHEEGNQKIEFVNPRIATEISNHILTKSYADYHNIYYYFINAGLLANLTLNEKLEAAVIRFFALSASLDTHSHNAQWLKKAIHRLWQASESQPDDLIRKRIPAIISGLLIYSKKEYEKIIHDFFSLLLRETNAKNMAIIIASHLYNKYRFTDTFSTEDLMSYFKNAMEDGNWNESFFAYDTLLDNIEYAELWNVTNSWIDDQQLADTQWAKHFARLYQIHYILVTLYRYFRSNAEETYELWKDAAPGLFPEAFSEMMKRLISDSSINSLEKLLEAPNNDSRDWLEKYLLLFECIEPETHPLQFIRKLDRRNTAYTLIADALEIWFYLLTHKTPDLKPDSVVQPAWKEYVGLVREIVDPKKLSKLRKAWSEKAGVYRAVIQDLQPGNHSTSEKQRAQLKQLQKRRASLGMMQSLLNNQTLLTKQP